ncbi:MAG: AbrB/MazE/SpoVT family DNA-binding domain-containing protein [Thaumarchaeota archaeon]|nr:AbrB/MazE/SpoVT family DNA-binding domain-containing protein [Nitrososphaerota archaeon]
MQKSYLARVKQKGQVTIPSEIRKELGMEEGATLEVRKGQGGVLLVLKPSIEPGKVVGKEEYENIISELDESRRRWR